VASASGPLPQQIKFWNARDGVGVFWHCTRSCRSELRTTIDGGRSWQFARTAPRRGRLAIAPGGYAWFGRFASIDDGRSWRRLPSRRFLALAFSDAARGWGVDSFVPNGTLRQQLARTSSGGRSWSRVRNPCDRSDEGLVDLSSPTPAKAWALCSGLYGLGNDAKAVYRTRDAGAHWALVNQSDFKGSGRRDVGTGLPVSGYAAGIEMSASGHGWLWEARGPAFSTRDAGGHWHVVRLTTADAREALSISFPSDDVGLMLIRDRPRHEYRLDRTGNGGRGWSVARRWRWD